VIVDNTPGRPAGDEAGAAGFEIVRAAERLTPAYARNTGAARGQAAWLVFVDADVEPSEDLLDRYFDPPPGEHTGLLAGGIVDEPVPPDGPAVARYTYLRRFMSQQETLGFGEWGFAKTANVACRRRAFQEVRGFRDEIRSGEDADLTFRLKAAGWEVELREAASVLHRNRQTVRSFAAQKLVHGAGLAWVDRNYPGAFPPRRLPGLAWWEARIGARRLAGAVRYRDRDKVLWALLEPVELIAHELGRWLPNERPLRRNQ
jgi:GT2 family glycosyltransferase